MMLQSSKGRPESRRRTWKTYTHTHTQLDDGLWQNAKTYNKIKIVKVGKLCRCCKRSSTNAHKAKQWCGDGRIVEECAPTRQFKRCVETFNAGEIQSRRQIVRQHCQIAH